MKYFWTKLVLVFFVTALVSPCLAQDQSDDGQDSLATEQQKVIELLAQTIQSADPTKSDKKEVLERALRFIQRVQQRPLKSPAVNFYRTPLVENYGEYIDRYQSVADVHAYLADQVQPSPYWIGVQCESVNEYSLKLEGDNLITGKGGLLITTVTEDSPAKDADLKVDDVILSIGDAKTDNLAQLVTALKANSDSPTKLSIVRDQQFLTIDIAPRLRSPELATDLALPQTNLANAIVEVFGSTLSDEVEATVVFNQYGVTEITFRKGKNQTSANVDEIDKLPVEYRGIARETVSQINTLLDPHPESGQLYLEYQLPKGTYQYGVDLPPKGTYQYGVNYAVPTDVEQETANVRLGRIEMQIEELTKIVLELKKE